VDKKIFTSPITPDAESFEISNAVDIYTRQRALVLTVM
jgi:hypothetical protein